LNPTREICDYNSEMMPEKSPKENDLSALKNAVRGQASHTPPTFVRLQLMAKISPDRGVRPALRWALSAALGMIVFILLWGIVQPGIVLRWVWQPGDVESFQVYRAPQNSDQFTFVSEIPTQESLTEYTLVDSLLLPGQTYTYQIIGFDSDGKSIFSQMVRDNSLAALPGQIALIVASLVITIGLIPGLEQTNFRILLKNKTAVL
jgi:hypothetical protein